MKSAIFMDGCKFIEIEPNKEEDFEKTVIKNSKMLFGRNTIYFDLKNKIKSKSLGASIPDGFLFDFKDKDNPDFYIVEVELAKHDFYRHIFPQITKFFAFFKNSKSRSQLVETLHNEIEKNENLENEFRIYLGKKEIYKALKEIIEESQNILIVIDENKPEFQEIMETYSDTWDKKVKIEVLKQYTTGEKNIFTLNPEFEEIRFIDPFLKDEVNEKYNENYHLEDVNDEIKEVYKMIKSGILKISSNIRINSQKYYISLRESKNFAYLQLRKRKLRIVITLPYELGEKELKFHKIKPLSEGVQKFYNSSCFEVIVENKKHLGEVIDLLKKAHKQ